MPGRNGSLALRTAIGALSLMACCGPATAQGAPPPAVSVIPVVSRQVTETRDFIGRVTAINKVDIVARVRGFIEERVFAEGQKVKTGDLLFRLEQATYNAAVEQQRANLAKAKATAVNAELQLQRGRELVRNQNIPQSTLDQRAADEAAAQADVMQAQALLDQAEINLGYTEIRSPIDGRIGLANFTIGNLVDPSSGKLATIVSQDPIYVIFQASERDVLDYSRRGTEPTDQSAHVTVHINLPNGTAYPHSGVTNFLDVQVDRCRARQGRCRDGRPQGRRTDHRRGDPEGAPRPSRDGDRRARKLRRMFSSIFIDRPRLAFVIAIVITLAGAIAIASIPIA